MSSIRDKYRSLVQKLSDKTASGDISWSIDEWDDVVVEVGARKVMLETTTNDNGEALFVVKIVNEQGDSIDRFTDEDITDEAPPFGHGSWFNFMRDLIIAARRSAKGADKALDELLSDLDDQLPF